MAWISVHESIDGPKLRNLYKTLKCSKFEAVGILNYLWMWGLNNVDENGYVRFADEDDVKEGIYKGGNGSNLSAAQILEALIDTGWIEKEEGKPLRLHDWDTWQSERYAFEKRLKNDRERKQRSRKSKDSNTKNEPSAAEKSEIVAEIGKGSEPVQASLFSIPEKPAAKVGKSKDYSTSFRELWTIYPRKEGKGETYTQYQRRLKDGYSEAELFSSAQNYADRVKKERTPTQYIKKGANFFKASGDFEGYLPKEEDETQNQGIESESYPEDWFGGGWQNGY